MRGLTILVTALSLVLAPASQAQSSLGLVEELSFTVPELTGPINRIAFNAYAGQYPVALVSDGEKVILHRIGGNAPIFTHQMEPPEGMEIVDYNLLLSDVNCDSVIDAVLCEYLATVDIFEADWPVISCRLRVYDGASYFQTASSATMAFLLDENAFFFSWKGYTFGLMALESYDLDGNGYNNLLVSFDYSKCTGYDPIIYYWKVESIGVTRAYGCFPGSILWEQDLILSGLQPLDPTISDAPLVAVANSYKVWDSRMTGSESKLESDVIILSGSGGLIKKLDIPAYTPPYPPCFDLLGVSSGSRFTTPLLGDIDPSHDGNELIAGQAWWLSTTCMTSGGELVYYRSSGSLFQAFQKSGINLVSMIWEQDYGLPLSEFAMVSSYPGSFFAVSEDALLQFSGGDGSISQSFEPLPEGVKSWVKPYGDDRVRLSVCSENNVSVYRIDEATGTPTEHQEQQLPETFALHQPYPNPFNSKVTIPVSIDRSGSLSVQVYNLMGQKVVGIYDGIARPGRLTLSWDGLSDDGKPVSSGIYLIQAVTQSGSASVKCVLLK
jgi:hypothetical protein